jgi:chromosome partitioning protein
MRTIAIANQKGGCGKTTTAVNLGAALAEKGCRVLIVDLDPQRHASLGFGYDISTSENTIYDVLTDAGPALWQVIRRTKCPGLDIAPSNILLSGLDVKLHNTNGKEFMLTKKLQDVRDEHDICIIDCSPSLSFLTLNALVAANEVIIPVQAHYYAIEGLKQLLDTMQIVRQRFNYTLRILGLLLTFLEERTRLSSQVEEQMRNFFGRLVFNTVIHRSIRLAEAPGAGEPILTYAPYHRATAEYKALADEITFSETYTCNKTSLVECGRQGT